MIERFSNPHFRKGREDLLVFIHRKASASGKKSRASHNASASATPQPAMDNSQQQLTDQRLVALERQVQFLHLQVTHTFSPTVTWRYSRTDALHSYTLCDLALVPVI